MEGARLAAERDLPLCRELLGSALEGARAMRGGAALVGTATADELLARWAPLHTVHAITAGSTRGSPNDASPTTATTLLVGEFHGAVVGLAAAVTLPREVPGQLGGRIECLFVEPEARGVGVGSALMAAALAWCREQSCTDVDALALPGDRSSKQRYEGAGFTARLITLSRKLV